LLASDRLCVEHRSLSSPCLDISLPPNPIKYRPTRCNRYVRTTILLVQRLFWFSRKPKSTLSHAFLLSRPCSPTFGFPVSLKDGFCDANAFFRSRARLRRAGAGVSVFLGFLRPWGPVPYVSSSGFRILPFRALVLFAWLLLAGTALPQSFW